MKKLLILIFCVALSFPVAATADTERTKAELLTQFADGQPPGSISPEDMRDLIVTTDIANSRIQGGLLTGGEVTINGGDSSKFDIAAGEGFYVDNFTDPLNVVPQRVSWSAFIAETVTNIGIQPATFISLDLSSGTAEIVQQPLFWNDDERRVLVTLVILVHQDFATIQVISSIYDFILNERQLIRDFSVAVGNINVSGNVFGPGPGLLELEKTEGQTFQPGINYSNSKQSPNTMGDLLLSPVIFTYFYQDGGVGFTIDPFLTDIAPSFYDNGSGTLQAVGPNNFTIQRIWFFTELNITSIHYGQAVYNTIIEAQNAINTEVFVSSPLLTTGFRAWMILKNGITDLAAAVIAGDAKFIAADKFGRL